MAKSATKSKQLHELLFQALQTELGGVAVYRTALRCVINDDLRGEWQEYLDQTLHHVEVVEQLFAELGLDPQEMTPGRKVVALADHHKASKHR